jgi:metallo-beta-lactamase class B
MLDKYLSGASPWGLRLVSVSLALALSCGGLAHSADERAPNKKALHDYAMKAQKIAGADLAFDFYHRCFIDPNYEDTIAASRKADHPVEPAKVFDQLYYLGNNSVQAWLLATRDGYILFDTLNNPEEAKRYIEGGMAKLGLDPKQIKHIVISHEHSDHFGGAKYLQGKYGAVVHAHSEAWKGMPPRIALEIQRGAKRDAASLIPAHGADIADGEKFTFGGTTLTFYNVPGHSAGSIAAIFPVTDNGKPHVIGFFGGLGMPSDAARRSIIINSFRRWRPIAAAANVDTLIGNHQPQDHAVDFLEFIRIREPGDANPFVYGNDKYQRYFQVQEECTQVNLARVGWPTVP